MKTLILLFIIVFALTSCAAKRGTSKGSFKLIIGQAALAVPMNGGIFLQTEDLATNKFNIIKLDADNSASIPQSKYNLLIVAFAGPTEKTGTKYCGSVDNASLLTSASTVTVSISTANCSDNKFLDYLSKLLGNSTWDAAKFDQGKWGP